MPDSDLIHIRSLDRLAYLLSSINSQTLPLLPIGSTFSRLDIGVPICSCHICSHLTHLISHQLKSL